MLMQRRPRVHADKHLQFIRELPCVVCGNNIETQAAHIRYGDPRVAKPKVGIGEKPDDKYTVPLCGKDHDHQHSMNEKQFWEMAQIDPVLVSLALYSVSGDYAAGEQIVRAEQGTRT